MKFNLSIPAEAHGAAAYLAQLVYEGGLANITKVSPKRSLNQNNYLHLLIGAFGAHFGYTLDEAKLVYKDINSSIYKYNKKGRTFYRSSAGLSKEDMAKSIDHFMAKSAEQGCPLPLATDQDWLRSIENEIERSKHYL